jgi:hypothetical protein
MSVKVPPISAAMRDTVLIGKPFPAVQHPSAIVKPNCAACRPLPASSSLATDNIAVPPAREREVPMTPCKTPQLTMDPWRPYCATIQARLARRAASTRGDAMGWIVCSDVGATATDVFVAAPPTTRERARATWPRWP